MRESSQDDHSTFLAGRLRRAGYEVQHGVGSGSGGEVYKAVQLSTGQAVAIKLLTLGELDGDAQARRLERFRREIAFCSSLYHPDIVRLLDSGELEDGTRFAVFEYIPGKTLADVLREEGMLKVQRSRNLMTQLLPPLAYAHAKGIAHRDLKPGNVMVTSDAGRDRLKILDFGISISTARGDPESHRLTQSHEWVGTPIYAAPEQLRGEPTGAKSDLYAWALMFVECLTGSTLISGKSLAEIIGQKFQPTPHVLPKVLLQHRLGALLLRVLEKDPARRLGDAQLLLSLLERISAEGLEDAQGYLKEASTTNVLSRPARSLTDTVTDSELPEQTEERHVTAFCCHVSVVGTGALSSVEQLDALLDDSTALVSEILAQFGATAAQSVGGYSLWYFGLAQTRDAEARLAVRAALEIVNRMEKLPAWFGETGLALAVQVGVHNGPVTVHLSEARRRPVDGLTARIAVQLASLRVKQGLDATAPRILVSEDFRELVSRYADLEPLEPSDALELAWRPAPMRAFRLTGESHSTSLRSDRAPFVGRLVELELLSRAWRKTGTGEGVAMLISGEAGIGKSRLAAELMIRLESEGCRALEARCLPEWQNAFLRPLSGVMRQCLGVTGSMPAEAGARIERKSIELGMDAMMAVPLFCVWLSVPMPPGYLPLTWSPHKQRHLLLQLVAEALIRVMERGSSLLVEDIHWADPSTLECLDALLGQVKTRSALIVLTTRPSRELSWTVAPEQLILSGLDDTAVRELATALLPEDASGHLDLDQLIARCDGIPLYMEELAIALNAPVQPPGSAVSRVDAVATPRVPASLRDLLTSRLDELGESRETAQFAAALGREFSLELLSALSARDELSLVGDLEELVSAQILVKRLRLQSPVYIFRHALIRDAAYDSMQLPIRTRVHERIAEAFEKDFASLCESEPDVLAHHFERAGDSTKAIHFWQLAAKKSNFASAHLEAIAQIDRALELLSQTASSRPRDTLEAQLLLTRGAILVAKRGYTHPDAKRCFERIIELVPARGETLQIAFAAHWCLWYFHNTSANLRESSTLADELRQLSQQVEDSALSLSGWTAVCESRFCTGKLEEAVAASRSCAAEYDFERHRTLALSYGDDPHLASTSFEALAELLRGRHALALQRVEEGLELAERLAFPALQAGMHGQAAWLYLVWGSSGTPVPNLEPSRRHAALAIKLSQEHGFPFWEIYGKMIDSAARVAAGDPSAVPELQQWAGLWRGAGANLGRCWHLTFIAQGLRRAGEFGEAHSTFDEALAFCEAHDSLYFEAEVRRQRAELLSDPANPNRDVERALAECARAVRDAAELKAHWWQLASLVTSCRIQSRHGKADSRELSELLSHFPKTSAEPPLLVEARQIVG